MAPCFFCSLIVQDTSFSIFLRFFPSTVKLMGNINLFSCCKLNQHSPIPCPGVVEDLKFKIFSLEVKFLKYIGAVTVCFNILVKKYKQSQQYICFHFVSQKDLQLNLHVLATFFLEITGIGINRSTGAALNTLFLCPQIIHSFVFIQTYFFQQYLNTQNKS